VHLQIWQIPFPGLGSYGRDADVVESPAHLRNRRWSFVILALGGCRNLGVSWPFVAQALLLWPG
jgi:hypothetical protein